MSFETICVVAILFVTMVIMICAILLVWGVKVPEIIGAVGVTVMFILLMVLVTYSIITEGFKI